MKCPKRTYWGEPVTPGRSDIAKFRKRLSITPPGGAEFGNTEVFYVEVQDNSPERAERLVSALVDQLEHRLQSLRNERAGSMVSELERGVRAAEGHLATEVELLSAFESKQGPLLSELRNLMASNGNQSTLEQQTGTIEQELRSLDAGRRRNEQLLVTLRSADQHPERLLATPSSLLVSQPTLLRLKEGLVNAQIRAAALLGTRSAEHPLVQAAIETQQNLREEINRQAPAAVRGVEMELAVANAREDSLRSKLAKLHATQSGLGKQRAEYAVLLGNVQNQTRVVDSARKQLADARAHRAGSLGASVLARIDNAEAGIYPIGPGRTSVTLAGGLAGLLAGLGAVFYFFAPKPTSWGSIEKPGHGVAQESPAPASPGDRVTRRESLTTSNGVTFDANPLNLSGSVYAGS